MFLTDGMAGCGAAFGPRGGPGPGREGFGALTGRAAARWMRGNPRRTRPGGEPVGGRGFPRAGAGRWPGHGLASNHRLLGRRQTFASARFTRVCNPRTSAATCCTQIRLRALSVTCRRRSMSISVLILWRLGLRLSMVVPATRPCPCIFAGLYCLGRCGDGPRAAVLLGLRAGAFRICNGPEADP